MLGLGWGWLCPLEMSAYLSCLFVQDGDETRRAKKARNRDSCVSFLYHFVLYFFFSDFFKKSLNLFLTLRCCRSKDGIMKLYTFLPVLLMDPPLCLSLHLWPLLSPNIVSIFSLSLSRFVAPWILRPVSRITMTLVSSYRAPGLTFSSIFFFFLHSRYMMNFLLSLKASDLKS